MYSPNYINANVHTYENIFMYIADTKVLWAFNAASFKRLPHCWLHILSLLVGNLLLNRVEISSGKFPVINMCLRLFHEYKILHVNYNIFQEDNAYLAASNYPKVFYVWYNSNS